MERKKAHLVRYISYWEVKTVLSRIPEHYRQRVRRILFEERCLAVRRLGYVKTYSRRDIWICPWLPPRVSLRRFLYRGQSAVEFGAPRVGQWTPWAVRRFLLYDVVLHELGHLQEINPEKKDWKKRFADETKAEEFADYWRRTLFSESEFENEDIVHYPPTEAETAFLEVWAVLDKPQRYELTMLALDVYNDSPDELSFWDKLPENHQSFLLKSPPNLSRKEAFI